MARAAGAGDVGTVAWHRRVVEEAVGLERGTVEVQRAAHRGEEVIRLDGVVDASAELERALIEDELARERIGTRRGEAVDGRGDRGNRELAWAVLDQRHAGVRDAVAAREGRIDRQVTDRPDGERREVVREVEDAARDGRVAAGADQDAARAQVELGAVGDGEVRVALHREGVTRGVADDRRARVSDARERAANQLEVGSGRGAGRGAEDGSRVGLVFGRSERAEITADATDTRGGEGHPLPRRGEVDERPREHRTVGGTGSASLTGERRFGGELDARTGRGRRFADAAEEIRGTVRGGGLGRSRVGPSRSAAEGEDRLSEGGVLLRDGEHVGAATAQDERVEVLVGREGAVEGADEVEVTPAHRQVEVSSALLVGEASLVEVDDRVVDGDGGAVLDEELGAPGAVGIDDQRALLDHEAVAGGVGDVRGIARLDPEGARAVFLDAAVGGACSDRELGGAENEVPVAGETERGVTDGAVDTGVNAAHDVERAARGGANDGTVGHRDQAGQVIAIGETLQLAAEIDAAIVLGTRGLERDRIGPSEAAGELEGRAHVGRVRRDRERTGTGRGGGSEAQDTRVDRQAAGPAGVVGGEDERAGLVLEQVVRQGTEGERRGQRERLARGDREGVVDGIQVERTGRGEGFRRAEAGIVSPVGGDRDRVGRVAKGRVSIDAQEAALDVEGLAGAAEGVDAAEGEEAVTGLGERETRARVGDDAVDRVGRVGGEGLISRRGGGGAGQQERRIRGNNGDLGSKRDGRTGDRHARR